MKQCAPSEARNHRRFSIAEWPRSLWFVGLLYALVLALLALPISSVLVPPLIDYPNHLARMHVLADYSTSPELQRNYVVSWKPAPYLAMDAIVPPLTRIMSIYTAGRVFLYICLLQFVLGTAAINAALFRRMSPWPAVSALFAYSLVFDRGYANYLFGIGAWLLAFAGWIALSRHGVLWRLLCGSVLSLAVYFSHFFAFTGYILCVGAYELGLWLNVRDRKPGVLLARGAIAFCPFIVPLILFAHVSHGQSGGLTWYGTPDVKIIALLSPVLFLSASFNITILELWLFFNLAVLLLIPSQRGRWGRVAVSAPMRVPLLLLAILAIAMPNILGGVWEADIRLPVVFLFLLIASCAWQEVPTMAVTLASGCLVLLLAIKMGGIVLAWKPIDRQYNDFRAALPAIPRGARTIAFWDDGKIDSPPRADLPYVYWHMPALAIIERDVYLPFLFKNPMMPVQSAPARRGIDTQSGRPIELHELLEAADPVSGTSKLGNLSPLGERNYWAGWPRTFDYAIEETFGERPNPPPELEFVAGGQFFNFYRIIQR